jgi:hypothetical protein
MDTNFLTAERAKDTENNSTQIHTVFALLGVLDEPCFLSELSRRIRHRPPNPIKYGLLFISRAKDADSFKKFRTRIFKNGQKLYGNIQKQHKNGQKLMQNVQKHLKIFENFAVICAFD